MNKKIKKNHVIQEARIRRKLENIVFDFDKSELKIIPDKKFDIVGRFFYDDSRHHKQRELDIFASMQLGEIPGFLFNLVLFGDIKNNDEYCWVFQEEEIENMKFSSYIEFPIMYPEPTKKSLKYKLGMKLDDPFPETIANYSFSIKNNDLKNENIDTKSKDGDKKNKKNGNRLYSFFTQVINGLNNFVIEPRLKSPMNCSKRDPCIIDLFVPIVVTSNNYCSYRYDWTKDTVDELNTRDYLLYLFNPPMEVVFTDRWTIPILLVTEKKLEYVIKKIVERIVYSINSIYV